MNQREQNTQSVEKTVARLSGVVEKQFGCKLDYEPIDAITHDHGSSSETFYTDLRKGEPVSAGDWVFFPVFVSGDLAGAARIPNRDEITHRTLSYLHSVIRMVIESRLTNSDHVELLQELEQNLREQTENKGAAAGIQSAVSAPTPIRPDNVVRFRDYQDNPFPLPKRPTTRPLNFSFLIESRSSEDIFKMALEIHSRSGRFAFLPFRDLSPAALDSADSFKSLGPLTVFVADITTLTFDQQRALVTFYTSARDKDGPQIVAGTLMTVSELKRTHKILPELWPYLSVGFLAMTQPFEIYKKENLLEFFYDSLTGRNLT